MVTPGEGTLEYLPNILVFEAVVNFSVVFEIAINKIIDFNFRIFSEVWPSMSVEDADGIGFDGVELFADEAVFAGIVGFIL